ncbi:MAG: radical SAM protein [Clostridia bacterium]|nr:radical SAM protein [Clostridia bacterium]
MERNTQSRIASVTVWPYADTGIMSEEILEEVVTMNYRATGREKPVVFSWQGDEPLRCGPDFFKTAVKLQRKHIKDKRIVNTIVTKCEGLNEEWANFFYENNFLVGLLADGRKSFAEPALAEFDVAAPFKRLKPAAEFLKKRGVHINVIACIDQRNVNSPITVYNCMKEMSDYLQFHSVGKGHHAVSAEAYGEFLSRILTEWYKNDENKVYVQFIEALLSNYKGCHSGFCIFDTACGQNPVVDYEGDVYLCTRCREKGEAYIGNIMNLDLNDLLGITAEKGKCKISDLPTGCMQCKYFKVCYGGCPLNRVENMFTGIKENALCRSYKRLFTAFDDILRVTVADYISYLR